MTAKNEGKDVLATMDFSKKVKILPWIGKTYSKQKQKVLILGESIWYRDNISLKLQACTFIKNVMDGWDVPFFNHVQEAVSEKEYDKENLSERKKFWNSVSFYEYVQSVLEDANTRPSKNDWESAKEPFKDVLKKLQPDIILVFGFELYKNLPNIDGDNDGIYIRYGKTRIYTWIYRIEGKPILVVRFKHAARAFKTEYWKNVYRKVVAVYKGKEL
jgi:hypothetical protein